MGLFDFRLVPRWLGGDHLRKVKAGDPKFPFRSIRLLPVPKPTVAQIRFFHQQLGQMVGNLLACRQALIEGGYRPFRCEIYLDDIPPMLSQLGQLELPYEVEVERVDRDGFLHPSHQPPVHWTKSRARPTLEDRVEHIVLDFSTVRSREELNALLKLHFPVTDPYDETYDELRKAINYQTCPIQLDIVGWSSFSKRMPRYAKRLLSWLRIFEKSRSIVLTYQLLD